MYKSTMISYHAFKMGVLIFASFNATFGALVLFSPSFNALMNRTLWKDDPKPADIHQRRADQIFNIGVRGVVPFLSGISIALLVVYVL